MEQTPAFLSNWTAQRLRVTGTAPVVRALGRGWFEFDGSRKMRRADFVAETQMLAVAAVFPNAANYVRQFIECLLAEAEAIPPRPADESMFDAPNPCAASIVLLLKDILRMLPDDEVERRVLLCGNIGTLAEFHGRYRFGHDGEYSVADRLICLAVDRRCAAANGKVS